MCCKSLEYLFHDDTTLFPASQIITAATLLLQWKELRTSYTVPVVSVGVAVVPLVMRVSELVLKLLGDTYKRMYHKIFPQKHNLFKMRNVIYEAS
jgi:hypothetical protein